MKAVRAFARAVFAPHITNAALHWWYVERWLTTRMHGQLDPRLPAIQERINFYEARMGVRGVKV